MTNKILILMLLFTFSSHTLAIPPPDNSSSDSVNVVDSIYVSLSNFDDIGMVMVWNGYGAETPLVVEWSGGTHGSGSTDISKNLTKGRNYIIFALYNKVYDGGFLFSGGKWSGNMSISKNNRTYWNTSEYKRNNSRGLKYWKVIVADVSSSGKVNLSQNPPRKELRTLREAMSEVEDKLDRGAGVARPF